MSNGAPGEEIERKFLLRRLPDLPPHRSDHIWQGYLQRGETEVRVRRRRDERGVEALTLTEKRGTGLARDESEQSLATDEFARLWPRTAGARIEKVRHIISAGDVVWEVDEYVDRSLVVAEVELPARDAAVTPPAWLAPHIVREVTTEPEFKNQNLAQ